MKIIFSFSWKSNKPPREGHPRQKPKIIRQNGTQLPLQQQIDLQKQTAYKGNDNESGINT